MTSADEKLSPRTWHRPASRPVSIWMGVFLLAGLAHPIIPDGSWLLVHIFTLGILTNSIMLWSQTLTERFLQRRLPDSARRGQLARTYVLNAALAGWLIASGSWARIVFSLLAFGALVAFLPLMARAAKIQVAAAELQVVLLGVRVLEVDHQLATAGDGHGVGDVAHVLDVHVHLQHALAAGERARATRR